MEADVGLGDQVVRRILDLGSLVPAVTDIETGFIDQNWEGTGADEHGGLTLCVEELWHDERRSPKLGGFERRSKNFDFGPDDVICVTLF